eukprot:CAMPEP_0119377312 /NCGR_PEP_ID=MMETSP1334-20130426/44201_1 /TAXON_ID=127549 /ORGANISM="Calcidiscus leptoporus, Strain RCC1130" /LENGTH=66 /DNA_ID=CAMNT_0007396175 /DNA_START=252 /DNA_END=448 /DNA_ORIENTATION=+
MAPVHVHPPVHAQSPVHLQPKSMCNTFTVEPLQAATSTTRVPVFCYWQLYRRVPKCAVSINLKIKT